MHSLTLWTLTFDALDWLIRSLISNVRWYFLISFLSRCKITMPVLTLQAPTLIRSKLLLSYLQPLMSSTVRRKWHVISSLLTSIHVRLGSSPHVTHKKTVSPITPSAPKCSSRHFIFHRKVRMFWVIRFYPSHWLFSRLINHSTVSLTIPLGD